MTPARNKPLASDVEQYIKKVANRGRREGALALAKLMQEITGEPAKSYGYCVGYGNYHYRYDSGREGGAPLVAFAARKANMVVYIMPGFSEYKDLLSQLGKHRTGKSCLYRGRLKSIDRDVLGQIVKESVFHMRRKYNV